MCTHAGRLMPNCRPMASFSMETAAERANCFRTCSTPILLLIAAVPSGLHDPSSLILLLLRVVVVGTVNPQDLRRLIYFLHPWASSRLLLAAQQLPSLLLQIGSFQKQLPKPSECVIKSWILQMRENSWLVRCPR